MWNELNPWGISSVLKRLPYFVAGVVLMFVKYNLDRFIARIYFQRSWSLFMYFLPGTSGGVTTEPPNTRLFYLVMVLTALPFIGLGIIFTLRRLRAVGLPAWMVAFFFVPILNLIFFAGLCLIPSKYDQSTEPAPEAPWLNLDAFVPHSAMGSAVAGVLATVIIGTIGTYLSVQILGNYGWGLFVGLPFCLGLSSVLVFGYHEERSRAACIGVSQLAVILPGLALLIFKFEGAVCLLMAVPIALPLAMFGGIIGYHLQEQYHRSRRDAVRWLSGVVIGLPVFMGAEHFHAEPPPVLCVASAVEVDAPPETVWKHVVSFAELPPPDDWVFKIGLAYPIRADIKGRGVGAVRHCVFSTGPFIEPITVWDEPRLLKFSVTHNPAPMEEWTPYESIHPPHLENFLVSNGGQFLLTPLANGRTRLEGTTWYRHTMWPANYWQIWSDFIIHRIHLRVLKHVKGLAETPAAVAGQDGGPTR